jgi:hypothetical protein
MNNTRRRLMDIRYIHTASTFFRDCVTKRPFAAFVASINALLKSDDHTVREIPDAFGYSF